VKEQIRRVVITIVLSVVGTIIIALHHKALVGLRVSEEVERFRSRRERTRRVGYHG